MPSPPPDQRGGRHPCSMDSVVVSEPSESPTRSFVRWHLDCLCHPVPCGVIPLTDYRGSRPISDSSYRLMRGSHQSGVEFLTRPAWLTTRFVQMSPTPSLHEGGMRAPEEGLGMPTAPSMILVIWVMESSPTVHAKPQMWKSFPARESNPRPSAIAAAALTTELLSWDSYWGSLSL